MVIVGITGFVTACVAAASLNHPIVPTAQLPLKVDCAPAHTGDGLANTFIGADGVGVTVTVTLVLGLTQVPFTHTP